MRARFDATADPSPAAAAQFAPKRGERKPASKT